MHISPSSSQPSQTSLLFDASTTSSHATPANAGRPSSPTNEPGSAPKESKDIPEGARVTLTAGPASKQNPPEFSPIYAEIWKNGMKVAEIDIHGSVNLAIGLVASAQGTVGGSGVLLAARRATEIARTIGGEIRVGGQPMDSQTLDMQAKLKIAYAS